MKKRRIILAAAAGIILLLILAAAASLWISANVLTVREFTADLGLTGEPVRAVVLADLHDHEFGEDNADLVQKVKEQKPDLILMDGDMLNEDSEDAHVPLDLIRQLTETAPVYYALGNHEIAYMKNGHPQLEEELEQAGAVVLEQNYVDLTVKGNQLRLGGLYEYAFGLDGNDDARSAPEEIRSFLQEFQNTDRVKLILAHRPDSFIFGDASQVWDVDLVISGHNHGGQVVLPFLGGLYGGDQGWFPEYIHGMYQKDRLQLFVTSGLGTSGEKLPRLNNPPEVAVLTLK